MSEIGEIFGAMREISRQKKANNRKGSVEILKQNKINFVEKNNGIHLIVEGRFDFYPSTGLFIERATKKTGRGVFNLIKKISPIVV